MPPQKSEVILAGFIDLVFVILLVASLLIVVSFGSLSFLAAALAGLVVLGQSKQVRINESVTTSKELNQGVGHGSEVTGKEAIDRGDSVL